MRVGGPYPDGNGFRVRWVEDDGTKGTKRHKTRQAAEIHAAELRGDPPPAPSKVPPPAAGKGTLGNAEWSRLLAHNVSDALKLIGDPAQRIKCIALLANSSRPFIDALEQSRQSSAVAAVLARVPGVDKSNPSLWAIEVSTLMVEAMAADPSNSALQALSRAVKGQIDSVVSAGRHADLETQVSDALAQVLEFFDQAQHGQSFVTAKSLRPPDPTKPGKPVH